MKEYKTKKAVVRIHGTADKEKVESATIKYIKEVNMKRRKKYEEVKQ